MSCKSRDVFRGKAGANFGQKLWSKSGAARFFKRNAIFLVFLLKEEKDFLNGRAKLSLSRKKLSFSEKGGPRHPFAPT